MFQTQGFIFRKTEVHKRMV